MTGPQRIPLSEAQFRDAIAGTRYEELFRDERKVDQLFIDLLKTSDDPMAREIGSGLADGTLTKEQLAQGSVYADFVQQNLASLQQMNMQEAFDEVAEEKRQAEEEAARAAIASEDDDLHEQAPWRGWAR